MCICNPKNNDLFCSSVKCKTAFKEVTLILADKLTVPKIIHVEMIKALTIVVNLLNEQLKRNIKNNEEAVKVIDEYVRKFKKYTNVHFRVN